LKINPWEAKKVVKKIQGEAVLREGYPVLLVFPHPDF
jgi:hypothetical protein